MGGRRERRRDAGRRAAGLAILALIGAGARVAPLLAQDPPADGQDLRAELKARYGDLVDADPSDDEGARAAIEAILEKAERRRAASESGDPALAETVVLAARILARETADPTRRGELLRTAFLAAEAATSGRTLARAAMEWADHLGNRGRPGDAIDLLLRSLPRIEPTDAARAKLLVRLAGHLCAAGRFDEGRRRLDEVEPSLDAEGDHRSTAVDADAIRAQCFLGLGLPDRAVRWSERAVERAAHPGVGAASRAGARLTAINVALARDDHSGAADLADAALRPPAGDAIPAAHRAMFLVRRGQASAELERDDPEREPRAARTLREALSLDGLTASDRTIATLTLAELSGRRGRWSEMADWLDAAAGEFAIASPVGQGLLLATRRAALRTEHALGTGDAEAARANLESLAAHFTRLLDEWAATPLRPGGVGFLHFGSRRAILSALVRATCLVRPGEEGVRIALETVFRAQALGSVSRSRGATPCSVDEVRRRLLRPDEGLLVLLPAPDRTHVLALDRASARHFEIDVNVRRLRERTRRFVGNVRRPPARLLPATRERRRRELREDGEWLVARAPDELGDVISGWRLVTISGNDLLGGLVFEALPVGESWLGVEKAIGYLPSVPLGLVATETPSREGAFDRALVGAPRPASAWRDRFAPLVLGSDRIERLLGPTAPGATLVRTGDDATLPALGDAARRAANTLLIWTHGTYDPERERPAGLLLSPTDDGGPGVAYADDLEAISPPPLVVLAACGAARGPLRRGEDGITTLVGAFLSAGARTVIAPSADVEEEATFRLLSRFHERVRRGDPPAEALRAARSWNLERSRNVASSSTSADGAITVRAPAERKEIG
ncbi:MAG: CHAT domain-containing protein, partial [Planctomycetota bacterium JB042]